MILKLCGTNDKIEDHELMVIAEFTMERLLKDVPEKLEILMTFEKEFELKRTSGWVIQKAPFKFLVWIRSTRSRIHQIKTIVHELTHVKQFLLGEMTMENSIRKNRNPDYDYWSDPIEIEARRCENIISKWYFQSLEMQ